MAIKVASWNVEGRLHGYQKQGRGTAAHILQEIARLDADVLVLPEFYMNSLPGSVADTLAKQGYTIIETGYGDVGRSKLERQRWGEIHGGLLSRLPVSNVEIIRPGGLRKLVTCLATDPQTRQNVRVIATHLEDRTEAMRVAQAEELAEIISRSSMPTVLLGDFNAMWHEGRAKLLAAAPVRRLAGHIPHAELRSMVMRATEMARGDALATLARAGLRDADPYRRPTATPKLRFTSYLPSIRLLQLDHMLVSSEISVSGFTVHADGGSDHRAISATLVIGK